MANTWKSPTEDTLFYLIDAQAEFLRHFGVETKGVQSLRRWIRGVRVPATNEVVRLECKFSPGRVRQISLAMYQSFLDRLNEAYTRAYEKELADG